MASTVLKAIAEGTRAGAVVSQDIRCNWWCQGMMGAPIAGWEMHPALVRDRIYDDQFCLFITLGARLDRASALAADEKVPVSGWRLSITVTSLAIEIDRQRAQQGRDLGGALRIQP